MAMGRRRGEEQGAFWIAASELPQSGGHPFYQQVNRILEAEGFDGFVEKRCGRFYARQVGRPSLPPAVYFRMLLIGYFEGIDSERGITWRVVDKGITAMRCCGISASVRFARTSRSRTAGSVTGKGSRQSARPCMGIVVGFVASAAND